MRTNKLRAWTLAVVSSLAIFLSGAPRDASAATETWSGGGANWNNAGSWVGLNTPPVAGDGLVFSGSANTASNNDYAANTSFGGITFAPGAGPFTLTGNPVLVGGDIVDNATAAESIGFTTVTSPVANSAVTSGGLVFDGGVSNVSVVSGGSLSLGQLTLGLVAQSTNVSTLNINSSVSASGLTVQTKSASNNVISVAPGATLSIAGTVNLGTPATVTGASIPTNVNFTGGGTVNATNGNFFVGLGNSNLTLATDRNIARVDMTALGNFSYSTGTTGTGLFGVGWETRPDATLKLTPGTNTIVAAAIHIGDSQPALQPTSNQNNNSSSTSIPTLFLGSGTNVINTPTLVVGSAKASGIIDWVSGSGSVTIAGQAGGATTTDITLGAANVAATFGGGLSKLSLAGHSANVQGGTVIIGLLAGATGGTVANTDIAQMTFDTGNFTANSFQIAADTSGAAANGVRATVTIGTNSSSTGVFTVNNTFDLGNVVSTVTAAHTDQAQFIVKGGTANINTDIVANKTNAALTLNSVLTQSGGILNMGSHNIGSSASPIKTISISGGTLNSGGNIFASALTLSGGTLNGSGTVVGSAITLSGGTLSGGVNVTGNAISVTAPLSVSGTASLAPVTLNGTSGTLTNSTGSALALPSGLTLAGDAGTSQVTGDVDALAGSRIAPGSATAMGTLQFSGNVTFENGSIFRVKLGSGATSDVLNATSGTLTLNGNVTLELGSIGTGAQIGSTYTVANFGALVGNETNLSITPDGSRKTFTVVPTATTGTSIQVSVGGTGPQSVTYLGNAGSTWTAGATGPVTWLNTTAVPNTADRFFNQDAVTFDDNSTNASDVTIATQVLPGSLTVSAARNYTFSGPGSIGGAGNLIKSGAGTLTIATTNTYAGTTDIQGGTVVIGAGGATGSLGAGNITNSGTIVFNRSDSTTIAANIGDSSNGAGSIIVKSGAVQLNGTNTFTGTVDIKSGALLKTGNRTALGATTGGDVTIENGGTLDIGGITASFTGPPTLFGSTKTFHISGTGVNNAGAITNSASAIQLWAFQNITLDGDATIGGARMDLGRDTGVSRTLDLQNHTLTTAITGSQPVFGVLAGTTVTPGNITVAAGGFDPEGAAVIPDNGGTITFNTGTFLQFFATADGAVQRKMVFKGNNLIGSANTANGIINSNMTLQGNVTLEAFNSGVASATAANPMTLKGNISESGGSFSITKIGVSAATLSGVNSYTGGTSVSGGTSATATSQLIVGNGHALGTGPLSISGQFASVITSAGFSTAMHQSGLSITNSAKLDMNNNDIIVDYAAGNSAALASTIRGYLVTGYNGGAWNGASGIVSSAAAADSSKITGLGYADAGDVGLQTDDTVSVPSHSVVVRYTYYGDSSLDGIVDLGNDFNLFLQGFLSPNASSWELGDYNYDGHVDMTDFQMFVDGYVSQSGSSLGALESVIASSGQLSATQRASLLSVVPEPSAIALLVVAAAATASRRRMR